MSDIAYSEANEFVSYGQNAYGKILAQSAVTTHSYNNSTGVLTISGNINACVSVGENTSSEIYKTATYGTRVSAAVWFSPNGFDIVKN